MTLLLYDHCELEERPAKHLKIWKVCHLILFVLAAVFGIVNYIILHHTSNLVKDNCVLYPRLLEFHMVPWTIEDNIDPLDNSEPFLDDNVATETSMETEPRETIAQDSVPAENVTEKAITKRETSDSGTMDNFETIVDVQNVTMTIITGNISHRLFLDEDRSLFALDSDCQFAEYMPIMSTVVALVWITMFTMCPGGGRARSGLSQPWRILTPALLCALVLVALTGHSFARTNGGLHAFCAAFVNVTHSTVCSSVDPFLRGSWNASWGFGAHAAACRAASAGAWAAWACAAALLLARCLAAPDFAVRRTAVHLVRDPQQKITPFLKKSGRRSQPTSPLNSSTKQDNVSVNSEPTCTTELVTANAEPQDSAPTSLMATPVRRGDGDPNLIEMTYSPQERRQN